MVIAMVVLAANFVAAGRGNTMPFLTLQLKKAL
jgi:hypothetical protein